MPYALLRFIPSEKWSTWLQIKSKLVSCDYRVKIRLLRPDIGGKISILSTLYTNSIVVAPIKNTLITAITIVLTRVSIKNFSVPKSRLNWNEPVRRATSWEASFKITIDNHLFYLRVGCNFCVIKVVKIFPNLTLFILFCTILCDNRFYKSTKLFEFILLLNCQTFLKAGCAAFFYLNYDDLDL